jgi:hypothetical protein
MLSKMMSRMNQSNALFNNATRAFRASAVANKKPSIGDAVTILQSKVSSINQVVSITKSVSHISFVERLERVRNCYFDW